MTFADTMRTRQSQRSAAYVPARRGSRSHGTPSRSGDHRVKTTRVSDPLLRTTERRARTTRPAPRASQQRPLRSVPRAVVKRDSTTVDKFIRRRLVISIFVLVMLMIGLVVWVGLHQTVWRGDLAQASANQRTRVNTLRADRGAIFDRDGNEIALSVPSTTVFADPRMIQDAVGTANALGAILQWTPEQISALATKLEDKSSGFVYVARQLNRDMAQALLGLGIEGVSSYQEATRVVESGVAGAVIGQTDPDLVGISGLEQQYNDVLTGTDGRSIRQRDEQGNSISVSNVAAPVPGDDLVLTIDKNLQFQTDEALIQRVTQLSAKSGTVIMMNSRTGEVYAMSNVRRADDGSVRLATANFAAVEAYEPGSVAKVFSVGAALNEGAVTDTTKFKVPGVVYTDGFRIADAYPHPPTMMTVRDIVRESSNLGTALTAQSITPDTLHDYLAKFGFGSKTALNYPNETKGILNSVKKWYGTTAMTIAYGYGFAASPLQLIAGVNTVANGGTYVSPKLVKATIGPEGKTRQIPSAKGRQVLTPETASMMTSILKDVVCSGTATLAQVKGMTVAGKTGTGYKAQANGTYNTDTGGRKYFASFVGYFPADDPQVTMLVSIDEPDGSTRDRFGGTAAAPLFARLADAAMHELKIAPTGTGTGCVASSKSASH